MIDRANLQTADAPLGAAIGQVFDTARQLGSRVVEVLRCCGAGYAAAAEYEELSKLSKAELERRGIPGGDLPQHILRTLTRR